MNVRDIIDAVPPELWDIKGWLVWRLEPHEDPSKPPRKMPYYASGRKRTGQQGSDADRRQLVPFSQAFVEKAQAGGFDGVGLAMLGWGIVALDFDKVIGTPYEDEVLQLVAGTYTELSPSGKGIRAFMRGSMPNMKSRRPYGFEIFDTTGYVTFTGNLLPGADLVGDPHDILDITDGIKELAAARKVPATANRVAQVPAVTHRGSMGFTLDQVKQALEAQDPGADYDTWIRTGMAVHHETQGSSDGYDLWHEFSSRGANYASEDDCAQHWASFGKRSSGATVTMRSLLRAAADSGIAIGSPVASAEEFDDVSADVVPLSGATDTRDLPAFTRDKQGRIEKTLTNVVLALSRPDVCKLHLGWDDFVGSVMTSRDGKNWQTMRDVDYTNLRMQLERLGFQKDPGRELMRDAVDKVADINTFDSAQLWLHDVVPKWDGVERIDQFLATYWGAEATPYTDAVSRYMWTALAGRVIDPGVKADMAVIFTGEQGLCKTSAILSLSPSKEFFGNIDFNLNSSELSRRVRGKLVMELGELNGLNTKEAGHIKLFISATEEVWRPIYRENEKRYDRRCIFFGTTNDDHFLADETGNRRFLPVTVTKMVDVDSILRDQLQLWAEARDRYELIGVDWSGAQSLAVFEHSKYHMIDSNVEVIEPWLDTPDDLTGATPRSRRVLPLAEIIRECLGSPHLSRHQSKPITQAMRRLGYRYGVHRATDGQVKRGFLVEKTSKP